jgi:hypothetical protein
MKKVFIGVVMVGFIGVAFFLIQSTILFNKDTPKTEKELQDIADKKYYKEVGQVFKIDSVELTVKNFTIVKKQDSITLLIDVYIRHALNKDSSFQSSFFVLKDETDRLFFPGSERIELTKNPEMVSLRYSLPAMQVSYFLYRLHLNSSHNPEQKSIIPLYKSYRSEG